MSGRLELDEERLEECPYRVLVCVGSVEELRNRSFDFARLSPKSDNGLGGKVMSLLKDPEPFNGVCEGVDLRDELAE